jgi:hypothetical protein
MSGEEDNISDRCKSNCLFILAKHNEFARIFVEERRGFNLLQHWLKGDCLKVGQLAYNVIGTLWILSYH